MKLICLFLIIAGLGAAHAGNSQGITLKEKNASLQTVLEKIKTQTGYMFLYTGDALSKAQKVTVELKDATLEQTLQKVFSEQPLTYTIVDKTVIIKPKQTFPNAGGGNENTNNIPPPIDVHGKIVNEKGEPVAASIVVKGTNKGTTTNDNGEFELKDISDDAVLVISGVSIESFEVKVGGRSELALNSTIKNTTLDETIIQAYGTTTRRTSTGNITKVSGDEIAKQPVSNVLTALEGRVPGLLISQTSGLPGSPVKIQLRGQSSIGLTAGVLPPNNPLFIIDGVPFAPNNNDISLVNIASGGVSPFASINALDIESIEVLKDADATSIYGSRGANGVILITTKKGRTGKTKFNTNVYTGWNTPVKTIDWLNTQQYIQIRREALTNDGQTIDVTTAPDILAWDSTRYTDFKKMFQGGKAKITNAQVSFSGGNSNTQFYLSGSYTNEAAIFPGDFTDKKGSLHLNLNHVSNNQKFNATVSAIYTSDKNDLVTSDATSLQSVSPNLPSLHNSNGSLNWQMNGVSFSNPLAFLLQTSRANTDNLLSNVQLAYKLIPGLTLRTSLGYNSVTYNAYNTFPIAAQDPAGNPPGSSNFGINLLKSWIVEPQAEYSAKFGTSKINVLIGGTLQQNTNSTNSVTATGYTSDVLLRYQAAAAATTASNNFIQYNYSALFGRVNYTFHDKYIVNLSGRRDGSSRFGPGKQFGNFGAIGAGWIFSDENFIRKHLGFLSFGKLRGSYGTTGNDQIGDYQYLDSWTSTPYAYNGNPGLSPTGLFNADFGWEINKKFEGALDLGFIKDRILISAVYFRNRSGNQLISYALPNQTGFGSIRARNFPAVVQNTGLEFVLQTRNITGNHFNWNTSFNISIPKNKLVSFPDLAKSSYSKLLIEGEPLHFLKLIHYTGVDPTTGVYQFIDVDKDGAITTPNDANVIKTTDPTYYGGFQNTFNYRGFQLDFLFQFTKQLGSSYLASFYQTNNTVPGTMNNQPAQILQRWKKSGDVTNIQKLSVTPGTAAFTAISNFMASDGIITDASFIRLKNLSLSYALPTAITNKAHMESCKLYFLGQNLWTITNYKNADPETQNLKRLAPLKTFVFGVQFSF